METNLRAPRVLFSQEVRYEIPPFQRRYVWEQEGQWEPLWDNVEQLAQSIMDDGRTEPHFMGAIVLQQKRNSSGTLEIRTVVDGQQRLTTLQLLIDAIQEVLEGRKHTGPAKRLASLVENKEEFRDGRPDNAFKVWPTVVDRDAFRHAMSNDLSAADYVESRIVQAHDYFKGRTEQWLDRFVGETKEREAATALDTAVRTALNLVVIDLGESDNPHVIFETLNARGTQLLQSDMVKNKILHDANIDAEEENRASSTQREMWPFDNDGWWADPVGRGVQRRPRIDLYLNHWLTLRSRKEMRAYDEFRTFERHASSRKNAGETIQDVARDMREIGDIYRDVEQQRRKDIAKFLERRKVMDVGAVTPLLLWLLSADLPKTTLANCLKALESYLVRRAVFGYSARGYGRFFVDLISRLDAGQKDGADKILLRYLADQNKQAAQATMWPDDSALLERFMTTPLYQWLTRGRLGMVLTGIEEQLRTERAETQEAPHNLHIEHIMPQKWHANWPLPEDNSGEAAIHRERAIHTIGNLTLVNNRLNSAMSNAPWDLKRKKLADYSVLFLNKELVNEGPQVWNETAIEERARWLCEKAIKVWPHHDDIDTAR